MIKYAVHPGRVISRSDSQEHFITGQQLIQLYGLPPAETKVITEQDEARGLTWDGLKHFYPRMDGNYTKLNERTKNYA